MDNDAMEDPAATDLSQLLPGRHAIAPSPFLTKTFDMVEDPLTNEIVSWSSARDSFIVWDCNKFSTNLFPMHFKHNNFTSFIRQLNTYGFRKINPERFEFAHKQFIGGQRQLLKNIKRLRNVGQSSTRHSLLGLHQQTMTLLVRALKEPSFVQKLLARARVFNDSCKKQRLAASSSTEPEQGMEILFSPTENDTGSTSSDPRNEEVVMDSTKEGSKVDIDFTWEELLNWQLNRLHGAKMWKIWQRCWGA